MTTITVPSTNKNGIKVLGKFKLLQKAELIALIASKSINNSTYIHLLDIACNSSQTIQTNSNPPEPKKGKSNLDNNVSDSVKAKHKFKDRLAKFKIPWYEQEGHARIASRCPHLCAALEGSHEPA